MHWRFRDKIEGDLEDGWTYRRSRKALWRLFVPLWGDKFKIGYFQTNRRK